MFLGVRRHFPNGFFAVEPTERAGVDQSSIHGGEWQSRFNDGFIRVIGTWNNDEADLQPVLLREFVVALIVRRDTHDGAGAIVHQDVISNPDGYLLPLYGLTAYRPVLTPCFSISPMSPASLALRCSAMSSSTFLRSSGSAAVRSATSGCSGAS